MFSDVFKETVSRFATSERADELWRPIAEAYSKSSRSYHNLTHLENLYSEIAPLKSIIGDPAAIIFAIAYHDVVYNVLRKDNEARSAVVARKTLNHIGADPVMIQACIEAILATRLHDLSVNNDINLFTDADMSILGKSPEQYSDYYRAVRKEYWVYPDLVYKPGRKKVLRSFLEKEKIYHTDYFFNKYEASARENIATEIESLD